MKNLKEHQASEHNNYCIHCKEDIKCEPTANDCYRKHYITHHLAAEELRKKKIADGIMIHQCFLNPTKESMELIDMLNKLLQVYCPSLRMNCQHIQKHEKNTEFEHSSDKLLVCLHINEQCVSHIMLGYKASESAFLLYSGTHTDYYNRKYNTMLRAVVIMLCRVIVCPNDTRIKMLQSWAVNEISAKIMISTYNTNVKYETDANIHEQFIQNNGELQIEMELDNDNFAIAVGIFASLINDKNDAVKNTLLTYLELTSITTKKKMDQLQC
jgi:hypothetical protein